LTFFFVNISFCDPDFDEIQLQENASVILGKRKGLSTSIKHDFPGLAVIGGFYRLFLVCFSAAYKKKLPFDIVKLSHDVCNYISVAKEQVELKEFQNFLQVAEHQILCPWTTK